MRKKVGTTEEEIEELLEEEQPLDEKALGTKEKDKRKLAAAIADPVKQIYVTDPGDLRLWPDLTRSREVYIFYAIDEEGAHEICQTLRWVDVQARKPVNIHISNPGGDVFAGLAIFDTIRAMRSPTTTIATGWAASMGGILLQAGDTRLITENSFLMIHEIKTLFAEGSTSKLKDELSLLKALEDKFLNILSERSKMTRKQITEAWVRKDYWMDAQQALKAGFVDGIVPARLGKKKKS